MFWVYILYSQSADKFYVGQTSNVLKRLEEHNNPVEYSKYTAKFIPWELVLNFQVSPSRAEAMKIEHFIKSQKSRKFILNLIRNKEDSDFFKKLIKYIIYHG